MSAHMEDARALMRAVCAAVSKPVIVAGSIDSPERIRTVKTSGFTIGTAILGGHDSAAGKGLLDQIAPVVRDVARLNDPTAV